MILIASSNPLLATSWHQALRGFDIYDLDVTDKKALDTCLKKVKIEVLLVDLALLGESGVHEISLMKEIQPDMNVIIMVKTPNQREEISAVLFGARAYCAYSTESKLLPKIVKTVRTGELWVDRKFTTRLLTEIEDITKVKHKEAQHLDKGVSLLTPRETEIATLVATGGSNRVIAEKLNISERTVKAHLGVIFRKIGINDRLQLALYMNRHQQIPTIWHESKLETHPAENDSSSKKKKNPSS